MSYVNRIKVVIDEVVYELTSHESPEYIQAVASYIDKKIKSIYSVKSEASINPRLKTLFISLNIADDLFKEREKNKENDIKIIEFQEKTLGLESEIVSVLEENARLKQENEAIKAQLEKANCELEEYVEAFELEEEMKRDKKVAKINR